MRSTLQKWRKSGNAWALQFSFTKQGQFIISADKTTEDALMEIVLDTALKT
ncbi:MAG: hypothetical protein ACLUKN_17485 [Bacilli bacterium]